MILSKPIIFCDNQAHLTLRIQAANTFQFIVNQINGHGTALHNRAIEIPDMQSETDLTFSYTHQFLNQSNPQNNKHSPPPPSFSPPLHHPPKCLSQNVGPPSLDTLTSASRDTRWLVLVHGRRVNGFVNCGCPPSCTRHFMESTDCSFISESFVFANKRANCRNLLIDNLPRGVRLCI